MHCAYLLQAQCVRCAFASWTLCQYPLSKCAWGLLCVVHLLYGISAITFSEKSGQVWKQARHRLLKKTNTCLIAHVRTRFALVMSEVVHCPFSFWFFRTYKFNISIMDMMTNHKLIIELFQQQSWKLCKCLWECISFLDVQFTLLSHFSKLQYSGNCAGH